jgi:hypothetical protein
MNTTTHKTLILQKQIKILYQWQKKPHCVHATLNTISSSSKAKKTVRVKEDVRDGKTEQDLDPC